MEKYLVESLVEPQISTGTSYSVPRILSHDHAYAIYYDTKYLSIIFAIFVY